MKKKNPFYTCLNKPLFHISMFLFTRRMTIRIIESPKHSLLEFFFGHHLGTTSPDPPQNVFRWMARCPSSSYSRLDTHIFLKVSSEARMLPPIQVE